MKSKLNLSELKIASFCTRVPRRQCNLKGGVLNLVEITNCYPSDCSEVACI